MKIVITTVQAPFIRGGAEFLANNLKSALIQSGYETEIITMPFMDNPPEKIRDHIVAARLMEVESMWAGRSDLCIGLKFPAYAIPHSNKVVWLLHQHRAAYDLFDTEYSNIKADLQGEKIRNNVMRADNVYLGEAKRRYTISDNVTARLQKYNGLVAQTLYHPCPDMDKFYCEDSEPYILMPSRINITKRQALAVEAMKYVTKNVKLYIVGQADNPAEKERLKDIIKKNKIEDKIKWFDFVEQEKKFELYAKSLAVLFVPMDEDYGYITLEAMASSKAVITASDSGGPLEFIENGQNGYVTEPEAKAIAEKIDYLVSEREFAKKLGQNSKAKLESMNISWDNVVKELVR